MIDLRMVLIVPTLILACAGVVLAQPVRFPAPAEAVHEGSEATFADLVRLVVPGIAINGESYSGGQTIAVPDIGSDEPDHSLAPASTHSLHVAAVPVRSGGAERMALLLDFGMGEYTVGFAVLALFDVTGEPRLIDAANVASGDNTGFIDPALLPVEEGNDLLVIQSTHSNSSQHYANTSLVLARDDRLELVDTIFAFSERTCAYERIQQLEIGEGAGEPFADITASMTETTTPSGEDCGDAPVPEPGTRTIAVTYRWDGPAGRYIPDSDALAVLAAESEKRF